LKKETNVGNIFDGKILAKKVGNLDSKCNAIYADMQKE
jgi:hypothetical protein